MAFNNCKELKDITLSSRLNEINDKTFFYCLSLEKITIPESVNEIGVCAFAFCESLTEISIPGRVKKIENMAFFSCTSLSEVHIEYGIKEICDMAFCDCPRIQSIAIPPSVINIGTDAVGFIYSKDAERLCYRKNFTIIGCHATEAERYAKDNNFIFKCVEESYFNINPMVVFTDDIGSIKKDEEILVFEEEQSLENNDLKKQEPTIIKIEVPLKEVSEEKVEEKIDIDLENNIEEINSTEETPKI